MHHHLASVFLSIIDHIDGGIRTAGQPEPSLHVEQVDESPALAFYHPTRGAGPAHAVPGWPSLRVYPRYATPDSGPLQSAPPATDPAPLNTNASPTGICTRVFWCCHQLG